MTVDPELSRPRFVKYHAYQHGKYAAQCIKRSRAEGETDAFSTANTLHTKSSKERAHTTTLH